MFCIIRIRKTPSHIKGYLRRFFSEVDQGLFVGSFKRKTIEMLWERVSESEEDFTALLILVNGSIEQGFELKRRGKTNGKILEEIDDFLLFGAVSR